MDEIMKVIKHEFSKKLESWKRRAKLLEAEKTELAGQVSTLQQHVQKLETGNSKLQGELAEKADENKTISRNNSQLCDKVQAFEKESSAMKNDMEKLRMDSKILKKGKKLAREFSKVFEFEDDQEISTASGVSDIPITNNSNVQCKPQCQESKYNDQNDILNYLKEIHKMMSVNLVNHARSNTDIENLSANISVLNEWRMKVETVKDTQISGQQQQVFQGGNANNSSNNENFSVPENQSESYNENCMPDITSDRYAERQMRSIGASANTAGMRITKRSGQNRSLIDGNLQAGNYQAKQANCSNLDPKLASAECAAAIHVYSGNVIWDTSNDRGEHINNPSNLDQYGNETCTEESIPSIQAYLQNYPTIQRNPESQPVEEHRSVTSVRRKNNTKRVPSATDKDHHGHAKTTTGRFYCLCGKSSPKKSQIAAHIRIKTGEKRWKCYFNSCDALFHFPCRLREHLKSKHKANTDRLNNCFGCYKVFKTKYSLHAHRNKINQPCYISNSAHLSKGQRKAFETQTQDQPHIIIKIERA